MAQPEIVVLSGVRTAIGTYGGSLKGKHATELGAAVVREAVKRATIKPEEVEHVVFGSAIPTDTRDIYMAACRSKRRPSRSIACVAAACRPSCRRPN